MYHKLLFSRNLQILQSSSEILAAFSSGRFIIGKDYDVPMQIWQHVDNDGKMLYSLVPASDDTCAPEKDTETPARFAKITEMKVPNDNVNPGPRVCEVVIEFCSCDKCGAKFPVKSMLNRHKMTHNLHSWLRRKRLTGRVIKRASKRTRKALVNLKYNCSSCDFGCNVKSALAVHVRKRHGSSSYAIKERAKRSSSSISTKKCADQSALNSLNKGKRRNEVVFDCNNCNFVCKRSSTLDSHVAQNHRTLDVEETYSKKRSRASKSNNEASKRDKLAETNLLDQETDISTQTSTPSEFEAQVESSMITRAGRKLDKKPAEEQCDQCDFKCSKKSTLYSHKRQHKTADECEVYSCNECTFKTCKKSSLYSHIKRKHKVPKFSTPDGQPQLFYCSQCDYKNKNKYELKVHVARKHTDDFKFSCETCGKKFKVKGDLTNHIRFSHKEQPVICDVCGKTCLNSNSLYVHQKFAHYKAKYECQVCKRRMVTQENLNEHMIRQHEKRENVVCEECGKTFSRNSRLKVHMRIHTGDKPYTCTICSKSFARRTALKQHLLIHTGIRPYVCDICGKAFTQKPGLISHRKSHPGSHPPLPRVLIDHILNDVMNN